jgi:ubiquinone/menaquinone biosynthesis C-methylase UbiE
MIHLRSLLSIAFLVSLSCVSFAEPPKREAPKYDTKQFPDPTGIGKVYHGREIAQVMGYQGATWLERPERVREEEPAKLIKALAVKPGMVVADVGAGSGYHSFLLAPVVGAKGKIIASDIQQEMLDLIEKKAKRLKVKNIELVKGTNKDPKLPEAGVDLIIMVDVYHEFEFPFEMIDKMIAALKPGGRLVFVEFKAEDDKVAILPLHKMSERQVLKEMEAFKEMEHVKTHELHWQHVIVFGKKEEKKKE